MKNNLKAKREDAGLTQQEVAVKAGLTIRYYQMVEAGRSLPTVGRARAIASVLKTTVEELWPINSAA